MVPPAPKSRSRSRSSRSRATPFSHEEVSQVLPLQRIAARSAAAPASRHAFNLASAPPQSDSEDDIENLRMRTSPKRPPSLAGRRIVSSIVSAISSQPTAERLASLSSLALVSQEYRDAAQQELFRHIHVTTSTQLELLLPILETSSTLALAVDALSVSGLRPDTKRSRNELLRQVRRLVAPLANLTSLEEDLAIPDWDIVDYKGDEYILSPTSTCRLKTFKSGSAWWEVSALHAFFTNQSELESVTIGGAVVDREWAGAKLLSEGGVAPARALRRLDVAQILHEDTLPVLLTATGGKEGELHELAIGFQSIDEDTPRSSIVSAFRLASSNLRHLTLRAPTQVSAELAGLLDDVVAQLPQLESIEWSEKSEAARIPLASSRFLENLPSTIRRLKARSLVSLSTSKVLALLEEPESVPSLAEVDIEWAVGRGDEGGREPWYRERHISRIQDAAAENGIECHVRKESG
ncbi:hypothetical protein JCM10908_006961 [Rhodotorula pacifica]|uniref:uncharacterized protein n=1 Tax=Rhodotorula pacifica TaxID=1495444 RepID=UPI00317225EB